MGKKGQWVHYEEAVGVLETLRLKALGRDTEVSETLEEGDTRKPHSADLQRVGWFRRKYGQLWGVLQRTWRPVGCSLAVTDAQNSQLRTINISSGLRGPLEHATQRERSPTGVCGRIQGDTGFLGGSLILPLDTPRSTERLRVEAQHTYTWALHTCGVLLASLCGKPEARLRACFSHTQLV